MQVRLREEAEDRWLEPGAVYVVLGIYGSQEGLGYRLLGATEPETPAIHPAGLFEVVDPLVSPRWQIEVPGDGGSFSFEPEAWTREGFWTDFFDGDPAARQIFDEECRLFTEQGGSDR